MVLTISFNNKARFFSALKAVLNKFYEPFYLTFDPEKNRFEICYDCNDSDYDWENSDDADSIVRDLSAIFEKEGIDGAIFESD